MKSFVELAVGSAAGALLMLGVVGCEPQHPDEIPGSANMVAEGNHDVAYTTPSRGMLYVYDTNMRRLVWAGEVDSGRQVQIDRRTNKISVDGNLVVNKLAPFHDAQIYFQPSSTAGLVNPPPANQPAQNSPPPGSITLTPSASVAPNQQSDQPNSLSVTPSWQVTPATQPSPNSNPR